METVKRLETSNFVLNYIMAEEGPESIKIQSWIKTFCENSQLGLKPSYSVYASKQDRLKYGCFK